MSGPTDTSRRWLLAALLCSLAGCATPRSPSPASAPTVQEDVWSGRLALNVEATAAALAQTMTASFELRGSAQQGELSLFSPLGQTLALASWSPAGATLQQGEQRRQYPGMAELTQQLTGAALPLAALFQWLRGQAADVPGWSADLSGQSDGRIEARRHSPLPRAELRIRLQP